MNVGLNDWHTCKMTPVTRKLSTAYIYSFKQKEAAICFSLVCELRAWGSWLLQNAVQRKEILQLWLSKLTSTLIRQKQWNTHQWRTSHSRSEWDDAVNNVRTEAETHICADSQSPYWLVNLQAYGEKYFFGPQRNFSLQYCEWPLRPEDKGANPQYQFSLNASMVGVPKTLMWHLKGGARQTAVCWLVDRIVTSMQQRRQRKTQYPPCLNIS